MVILKLFLFSITLPMNLEPSKFIISVSVCNGKYHTSLQSSVCNILFYFSPYGGPTIYWRALHFWAAYSKVQDFSQRIFFSKIKRSSVTKNPESRIFHPTCDLNEIPLLTFEYSEQLFASYDIVVCNILHIFVMCSVTVQWCAV